MRLLMFLIGVFMMSNVYATDFMIKSSAFTHGTTIPTLYTCSGKDISPPLAWSGAPTNTRSFVLLVSDPDAPAGIWYHWVVFNIPGSTQELTENIQQFPAGTILGNTSYNRTGYNGPCPPPGNPHHYFFTLYALDSNLTFPTGTEAKIILDAMKNHILQTTQMMGLFGR